MSAVLERRLRQHRSRLLIRAWDYRQRRHARGVWFRLRRLLAAADTAYVIDALDVDRLLADGYRVEPVGRELEPPKRIVVAPAEAVSRLESIRQIPVSLRGDFLAASSVALVPFGPDSSAS